ncbi:MAG TPA: hypothetical protein VFE78_14805, partial [Gemmataceae bacterium]|nr:hypothetical protein [Gemmataceae bacterium]
MRTVWSQAAWRWVPWVAVCAVLLYLAGPSLTRQRPAEGKRDAPAAEKGPLPTSYDQVSPVLLGLQSFEAMLAKDKADKPAVTERQQNLLKERYDLTARPDPRVKMTRGKPVPVGPATRLPEGTTWETLAKMSPEEVRDKDAFPGGFLPLPHPHHEVGGMLFPQQEIKLLPRLTRFDLDFDLPEH